MDRHAGQHEQTYTNLEYESDGIHQESRLTPAATTLIPLPRALLSFLVKQPGGLGCKLHSEQSSKSSARLHLPLL